MRPQVRDRLRTQLDGATRRRLLAAEARGAGGGRGGAALPASAESTLLADFLESQQTDGGAGSKPPHWRVAALAHGLLAAGSAAELDLTVREVERGRQRAREGEQK